MTQPESGRREFLKRTSAAALTSSSFTGRVRGANDRVRVGVIGVGNRGRAHLGIALAQPGAEVAWVSDVYQPRVDSARETTRYRARGTRDFREVLADKSVDAVAIATPCHWHAYMAVEASKAGKDVYVEKPVCLGVDEGRKMVQAARKYGRIVQVGLQQRAAPHFRKAVEMVRAGALGTVTFCRTWNYTLLPERGMGKFTDSEPLAGLDWDMWTGPAEKRPFNMQYWFLPEKPDARFSYFWAYGGGMATDWAVHLMDIVQMAFDEQMPGAITALGGKFWLKDDRDTPDTLQIAFEYPRFLAVYENRWGSSDPLFGQSYGTSFHGSRGTLFVNRGGFRVVPEKDSGLAASEEKAAPGDSTVDMWANFLECVRTRRRPICDIEIGYRSTATCILGNGALLSRRQVGWDSRAETISPESAAKFCNREYRPPWKLEV